MLYYPIKSKEGPLMDLHDYKDVAENYDLYLDVMYLSLIHI